MDARIMIPHAGLTAEQTCALVDVLLNASLGGVRNAHVDRVGALDVRAGVESIIEELGVRLHARQLPRYDVVINAYGYEGVADGWMAITARVYDAHDVVGVMPSGTVRHVAL